MEKQQIVFNQEKSVSILDGCNEFIVTNVRKIEIESLESSKLKINIGAQVTFISSNKKIVINQEKDSIVMEMLNSEEQLDLHAKAVDAQEARGLIDYILQNAPDVFVLDNLLNQPLEELRKLKESMDDLANCY